MSEATETAKTRVKQNFYLAKVEHVFTNRTDAEKFINDNKIGDDVAILRGREVKPVEQKKMVLN